VNSKWFLVHGRKNDILIFKFDYFKISENLLNPRDLRANFYLTIIIRHLRFNSGQ
jgi:hypothetical protein